MICYFCVPTGIFCSRGGGGGGGGALVALYFHSASPILVGCSGWGVSPCHMLIIRNGYVALSILRIVPCHPVDFKKTSCRPVDLKKVPCRIR